MPDFKVGVYEDEDAVMEGSVTQLPGAMSFNEAMEYLERSSEGGRLYQVSTGRSFEVDTRSEENLWIEETLF